MADTKNIEAVMNAALRLSFEEWKRVSKAITRAFVEKEHRQRSDLKLEGTERIKYFYTMFEF